MPRQDKAGNKSEQGGLENLLFSSSFILVVRSRSCDWSCASFLMSSFRRPHSMATWLFSSWRRTTSASKPALQLLLPTMQEHLSCTCCDKVTTCFFLLFVTELDDQVLVLCLLLHPLLVGGFKLVAQAFHLGRQFFIACCDPLNLVEALLSVPCGLHQVLQVKKLS